MEFKIDNKELKELLMDEDSDMLTVVSALCLYAEGMNAERVARPMKDAEKSVFYDILKRSGYENGGDGV
nr:MAG TPA: hypothetical protein [Caudoviricetes sp.]